MNAATIFVGKDGVRAGWRVLIYLIVTALCVAVGGVIARFLFRPTHVNGISATLLLRSESLFAAMVVAGLFLMAKIERVSLGTFGLPARTSLPRIAVGAVWGFAAMTALLAVMHLLHGFDYGSVVDSASTEFRSAVLFAIGFFFVGVAEEVLFRSYLLFSLARGVGFWPAAVISSAGFAFVHSHNAGETIIGLVAVFAVGLLFCLFVQRTGNLWFPIGFHAAWDWAETYFYGVPDSGAPATGPLFHSSLHGPAWLTGGTVGPEGSWLCFIAIVLTGLLFAFVYRTTLYHPKAQNTFLDLRSNEMLADPAQ